MVNIITKIYILLLARVFYMDVFQAIIVYFTYIRLDRNFI